MPEKISEQIARETSAGIPTSHGSQYFADGARVTEPINEHQKADLNAWLGGREPGMLADTDLNPILN